jgi:hypothetical protein
MANKFLSVLETIGRDFQKGLMFVLPFAETAGAIGVQMFFPALGPAYNSTVAAVVLAEQKYAAMGKQSGSGAQKLEDVVQIVGPVVAQALSDAGKSSAEQDVKNYVNSVVNVWNSAPSPVQKVG